MVTERVVAGVARHRLVFGIGVTLGAATVVATVLAADHPARAAIDAFVVTTTYTLISTLLLHRVRRRPRPQPAVISMKELPPVVSLWKPGVGSVVLWGCMSVIVAAITLDHPQDFALPGIMLGSAVTYLVIGERAAVAAEREYAGKLWIAANRIRSTPGPDRYIVLPEHPVVP